MDFSAKITCWSEFQPIAAIATTPRGAKTLQPLCQSTGATLWLPEAFNEIENARVYTGSLQSQISSIWQENRAVLFCLAAGAVVRLIAPLLKDKSRDPAVLVLDREGGFVISLCSGHQGGADRLAQLIAQLLGATPILTGASASLELPGIDVLGTPFGWRQGEGDWTGVSGAIARGQRVRVIQEVGSTLWQKHLPSGHPFDFSWSEERETSISPQARIWISVTKRKFAPSSDTAQVQWHPRVLWVGIGCERGTSKQLITTAIERILQRYNLASEAIAGIATIDLKADEEGILEVCRDRHLPLKTFCANLLSRVEVPNPSTVVEGVVGTPSVAEAAAILASQANLIVPKQIIKQEGEPGAVTLAIASADREYIDRQGRLLLVGIGPGSLEQITPAAKTAIVEADAVIGYSLYIDLIASLRRPGQIIESLPLTRERQRAQRAIELAQWGLTVAVVSSGDCGIYGMGGLVLEELQLQGWNGRDPQVEIFPGISAMQAAAARVGVPLMHDFCGISLSDLLTPWEVIEKRLEAAAMGNFVTAIYNPRSSKRTQQIAIAQKIFLQYRPPHTPVAIVRSAYRQEEQITLTTLDKMLESPIDMLTTVIIGNRSTYNYANWIITPRGYLGLTE
ncbi:MAG: precorrin-3B C(17)-methyltransferase [Prochloraceae cyanobacterium]